jgi:hypothetical protein
VQNVQAQFKDFMGQINALKVVVVQLEQKLRLKSEEQVGVVRRAYDRSGADSTRAKRCPLRMR